MDVGGHDLYAGYVSGSSFFRMVGHFLRLLHGSWVANHRFVQARDRRPSTIGQELVTSMPKRGLRSTTHAQGEKEKPTARRSS